MTEEQDKSLVEAIESLNTRIEKQNILLASLLLNQRSIKQRIFAGLWTGFGTVLGATVIVSGVIFLLKPLAKVDWISPIVDRVINALESRSPAPKPKTMDRVDR